MRLPNNWLGRTAVRQCRIAGKNVFDILHSRYPYRWIAAAQLETVRWHLPRLRVQWQLISGCLPQSPQPLRLMLLASCLP